MGVEKYSFNSMNRKEADRFVEPVDCRYFVTVEFNRGEGAGGGKPPAKGLEGGWKVVAVEPFLDAAATKMIHRMSYVPKVLFGGWDKGVYGDYVLYKRAGVEGECLGGAVRCS